MRSVGILEPVDAGNVLMAQSGDELRFALEAGESLVTLGVRVGEHLDGDVPSELGIQRTIHFAHTAPAHQLYDLVVAELRTGCQAHVRETRLPE